MGQPSTNVVILFSSATAFTPRKRSTSFRFPLLSGFLFEKFDCLTDEVSPITCRADFFVPGPAHVAEDQLCNLQPFLIKEASLRKSTKVQSLQVIRAATLSYGGDLPKLGTTLSTAPLHDPSSASSASAIPVRSWMMHLHPSHKLWTAGGLALCSECGAVSQGDRGTRLSLGCGTKRGKVTTRPRLVGQHSRACKMPAGSIWRTKHLLAGKLRGVGKTVWPNGTAGSVIL